MSPLRPTNTNKRVVSATFGNGGLVGGTKTPYLNGVTTLALGTRGVGGCCQGRFTASESACGVSRACNVPATDCGGFFICCTGGTKWIVAPSCTEVQRGFASSGDAVTVANSLVGSCGWFVAGGMNDPGYVCRQYWDTYQLDSYWSSSPNHSSFAWATNFSNGSTFSTTWGNQYYVRAFRCA